MSFRETLVQIAGRMDGVLGAVVIGEDGIPVDTFVAEEGTDVELAGVEYMGGCRDLKRATADLGSGEIEEVSIRTGTGTALVRRLGPGYYLVLLLAATAVPGRGRYELKRAAVSLAPEFS